jgi:CRISPR/Cas system-associated exonuclease Cas4 (RecB family)
MAGMQCHKRLYLEIHEPGLAGASDDSAEAILEAGHRVGALARKSFPGGTLIGEGMDWSQAHSATRVAIRDPSVPAIFEPAIAIEGVRIRADILARTRDRRFDLIEVKSTLDIKPEHEWDVAVQYYVLKRAGVPIRWARLMHLNRDYVYPGGDYDLKRLFRLKNLTRLVRKRRRKVVAALKEMRKMLGAKRPPAILVGPQCTSPYVCPFYDHCHGNEPEHSIEQLPRLGVRARQQLAAMGVIEITNIPPDFDGLSGLQARVVEAVQTESRFHDLAISRKLRKLKFPVYFLDFETFAPALPLYAGTKPYQIIPFQWSVHVLNRDGAVMHREYLHDDRTDPRRPFAKRLLETVGKKGSIVVYSSFEATRLRDLGESSKDLAPQLARVRERIIDLLPLIRDHIYDPEFHGSFSLKSVAPVLVPDLSYDGLEIADGGAASLAYAEMEVAETSDERRAELRAALLVYCKRDTEALVRLFKLLR